MDLFPVIEVPFGDCATAHTSLPELPDAADAAGLGATLWGAGFYRALG